MIYIARARKNLRISEFSGGRLFEKIEWGPPLKTEKLLWVMKKTEKARIEWGGSHSILATGGIQNLWVLPFCQDRMAAAPHLEVLNPFYPGNKAKSRISWKKIHEKAVEKTVKVDEKDKKNCENGYKQ